MPPVLGAAALAMAALTVCGASAASAASGADAVAPWQAIGTGAPLGVQPHVEHPGAGPAVLPHIAGTSQETVDNSSNWSGSVETGTTFSSVSGQWTVPTVQPSQGSTASGTWVGIDGFGNSDLIQTGTAQTSFAGFTSYTAWYEILPNDAVTLGAVSPGDQMSATVSENSPGKWTIFIADLSSNQHVSIPVTYSGPADSAEWITELPSESGPQPTLANFGSVQFTGLGAVAADPAAVSDAHIVMTDSNGVAIAYPTFGSDSVTIHYGQAVSQTSVSTNLKSVAQGTLVTYSAAVAGDFAPPGNGTVSFSAGSTPLCTASVSNGSASCMSTAAPAGNDTITGTYSGDLTFTGSSGSTTLSVGTGHGYWLVGSDGGIFTFGAAQFFGSTGNLALQRPVVGIVPTADHGGYWLDASDGGIFAYGDTQFYGSIPQLGIHPFGSGLPNSLNAPIVGMVPSADDNGYFMVGSDGGVFAFGDAHFAGSCPSIGGCAGAAVAVMPDASGRGYWVVTQTGNVYTFGDAPYFGAPGPQSVPVTSAVRSPDGEGYMILFGNGAIAAFGHTPFADCPLGGGYGALNPASAIFDTADGGGYWVAAANGTVANCGDAPADGDMAGARLNGSIIAATGW